jgi:spore coat protein JC
VKLRLRAWLGISQCTTRAYSPATPTAVPFTAAYIQSTGDPIADILEDLAAEQKARATYEHLMTLTDNPDIIEPLRFLRQREVNHYQRFGECLQILQEIIPNKGA